MFSAAILAGGQSTRFGGRDKGSLVVDGLPIVERQLAELSLVADDLLLIGGDSDTARRYGIRYVAERIPGNGPMGGLFTALTSAKGSATLVVACDMPYVSAPFAEHLLSLASDADAVVPRTERGYHPLCAAYTRACIDPIAQRLAGGRLKLADLLSDVRVHVVTGDRVAAFGDPERLLANVNTPDEYGSIEANKP